MSWAKRNLYFLISAILAVVLLLAAAWYCYSSWGANNTNWDQLNGAYTQMGQLKNPSDEVIQSAKDQTKQVEERIVIAKKVFAPFPSIPANTNQLNDRSLAFAVLDTITGLRSSAAQHNVIITPDFSFSFTLQRTKTAYDPNSWAMLARQLGEVKVICDTLFSSRIAELTSIQRERTTDDAAAVGGGQPDYVDAISVTNSAMVITPYQVTFQCFTTELGSVLSSFANGPHTIVVKTLMIEPQDAMNTMEGMTQMPMMGARPGGLPVMIDEKRLRVTLFLDIVKGVPSQGG